MNLMILWRKGCECFAGKGVEIDFCVVGLGLQCLLLAVLSHGYPQRLAFSGPAGRHDGVSGMIPFIFDYSFYGLLLCMLADF
jgi:hypothetical protein